MTTRVLLTIDTELLWRHHAAGLSWEENFARSYHAAGVGIPYQLQVLADHGLKACFFVDPMPGSIFGLEPVRRLVGPILAAGQEIQLHLHPFWARLEEAERSGATAELASYGYEDQLALIRRARDLLVAAGAPDPIAFRAGSYAANGDTIRALAALSLRYDSSHNGGHHPHPSAVPLHPRQIAPVEIAPGLVEVPVGQISEGEGGLRHLQLCALSFAEIQAALDHGSRERHPLVTIVSHSFELATRNGLAPNEVVRQRFLRLCRYLAKRRATFPTAWFTNLADLSLDVPAQPARGGTARRLRRMAGQAWSHVRYERPFQALARQAAHVR